jgi:predicted restriction endonuclease
MKQSELRNKSIKELKSCPFTKINDERLLIVSHIKPWAFSDNKERLDLKNVLVFSPLFDKLFDRGLISFKDNKSLLISK